MKSIATTTRRRSQISGYGKMLAPPSRKRIQEGTIATFEFYGYLFIKSARRVRVRQ